MKTLYFFLFLISFGQLYTNEHLGEELPKVPISQWHNKICPFCNKHFPRPSSFKNHFLKEHGVKIVLTGDRQCPIEGCHFGPKYVFIDNFKRISVSIRDHILKKHKDCDLSNHIITTTDEQNLLLIPAVIIKNNL